MSKNAVQKFITCKLPLQWITITGEGKPNMTGTMQYVASGIIDPDNKEHMSIIKFIDEFWKDHKPEGFKKKPKSLGYYRCEKVLDKDGEPIKNDEDEFVYNQEGKIAITFKTGVTYKDGSPKKIVVRNAKNQEVELGSTRIGNGSMGYIGGSIAIYTGTNEATGQIVSAGVTFYLDEIKLTSLEPYTASAFADHEGEDDDDGWTGAELNPALNPDSADEEPKPRL